eukprot:m.384960 g.384960  ORF g.384960 m.384960 type:complete len:60 (+) comp16736_c0_seq12:1421-1600(+)
MVETTAEKDSTGELGDLLERLEVSDDDGFELPHSTDAFYSRNREVAFGWESRSQNLWYR